jgi:hypothetical protein
MAKARLPSVVFDSRLDSSSLCRLCLGTELMGPTATQRVGTGTRLTASRCPWWPRWRRRTRSRRAEHDKDHRSGRAIATLASLASCPTDDAELIRLISCRPLYWWDAC